MSDFIPLKANIKDFNSEYLLYISLNSSEVPVYQEDEVLLAV